MIVDHPQANLYSLYRHLSPSRWSIDPGLIRRGELVGNHGDEDENGGSPDKPLIAHLHFGIRTGQRVDFPSACKWRWQAGWLKPCPQSMGWLQPSLVFITQSIPQGGFSAPEVSFSLHWRFELFMGLCDLAGGLGILVSIRRGGKDISLHNYGLIAFVAGAILRQRSVVLGNGLFVFAALSLIFNIVLRLRQRRVISSDPFPED